MGDCLGKAAKEAHFDLHADPTWPQISQRDTILVKVVKSIFKLGFYAAGVGAVVGVWDYTQQAKAAEYQYTFEAHKASLGDRYGSDAQYALGLLDFAKGGLRSGVAWADEAGLLAKVGVVLPAPELESAETVLLAAGSTVPGPAAEALGPVEIAVVRTSFAPETSLFPPVRALR